MTTTPLNELTTRQIQIQLCQRAIENQKPLNKSEGVAGIGCTDLLSIRIMKAEILEALKDSINHWNRMATGKAKRGEVPGPDHCALCHMFNRKPFYCRRCPVMKRTHLPGCGSTPYGEAEKEADLSGMKSPAFKEAAAKELKFLKSLLPKKFSASELEKRTARIRAAQKNRAKIQRAARRANRLI